MSAEPRPIDIPAPVLLEVFREARRAFPAECCGWLAGPADVEQVTTVRPCTNAQAAGAPAAIPDRTCETAFVIAGADLLELNRSLDGDRPARVIYHSHTDGSDHFSSLDRQVAATPELGGPSYPVQHLVVAIDGQSVVAASLYAWSERLGDFDRVARFPGAAL